MLDSWAPRSVRLMRRGWRCSAYVGTDTGGHFLGLFSLSLRRGLPWSIMEEGEGKDWKEPRPRPSFQEREKQVKELRSEDERNKKMKEIQYEKDALKLEKEAKQRNDQVEHLKMMEAGKSEKARMSGLQFALDYLLWENHQAGGGDPPLKVGKFGNVFATRDIGMDEHLYNLLLLDDHLKMS